MIIKNSNNKFKNKIHLKLNHNKKNKEFLEGLKLLKYLQNYIMIVKDDKIIKNNMKIFDILMNLLHIVLQFHLILKK